MSSTLVKFIPEAVKRPLRPYIGGRARHFARADRRFVAAWPVIDSVDGWLSKYEAELLFALARGVPEGQAIVEIGSYKGRSTVTMAAATRPGVSVYAVDPHTGGVAAFERGEVVDTWDEFRTNLVRAGASSVVPVRLKSVDAAASYDGPEVGFLFVDGWHSTEAVLADYEAWKRHLASKPTIVFDDWDWPEVRIAIDVLREQLPRRVGVVGKDEVFADSLPRRVARLVRSS